MTERELLTTLLSATSTQQVANALAAYVAANPTSSFEPVGRNSNNRGSIEVASDAGRSLIERVTNMLDAILELEHEKHGGHPIPRSPREAASIWLGVPEREGLAGLSNRQRQDLASRAVVRLEPGEGSQSRIVTVIDRGIGIEPDRLESTILSLHGSNKIEKHYLAGTYGQGGSSTFAFCQYAAIISRRYNSSRIGFTVVKYEDLPAERFKTGRYVFLAKDNAPLEVEVRDEAVNYGTIVRHFGYDLTGYTSVLGPRSVYGTLGRVMFDPVSAIRFENRVNNWNRTIKGARNALNGAVDEGDEETRGPNLDHNVPMFNVDLGDFGSIGIEYWVLAQLEAAKGRGRTRPAANFVDPAKPIILTHNGQNQGELSGRLISDDKNGADLPYLQTQGRLICHLNCDRLSPAAKRMLFSSTREHSREGFILDKIRTELVSALKADDELVRLNAEAREQSLKQQDENARRSLRRQVARLLRIGGALRELSGGVQEEVEGGKATHGRRSHGKPESIELRDPPTYINIVWDEDKSIPFYAGQRRYVRIETDANSDYHNPFDRNESKVNIAVGGDLRVFGTSPLKAGRMRIGIEGAENIPVGSSGSIRVELYRPGMATLSDEREYRIVETPEPRKQERQSSIPEFEVVPVSGPTDEQWDYVCGDSDDADVSRHASNFLMNEGILYVYYSESFPRFARELKVFEQQGEALAASFRARYEMWLAVHSLLMYQEAEAGPTHDDVPDTALKELARQERSRLALIAALVASQEVKSGAIQSEEALA